MDVALFVPCYVDQLAPQVGIATADVLERLGCRVHVDPQLICCGQPFLTAGALEPFQRLRERFRERLEVPVVCPSASCVATLRKREEFAPIDGRAMRLSNAVFELSEFVVKKLGRTDVGARFPHRVALLQSCHGLRELGLGRPSERLDADPSPMGVTERLLRGVAGLELVAHARGDECCGFGGVFSVDFPELSGRIGRDKLRALEASGAEVVTGTDVSCLLHLEGLRRREGFGPRPVHVAEILASGGSP